MEQWKRLARLAGRQYGVIALHQAVGSGLAPRTVQDHADRFGWVRLHRGVYALPGSTHSTERRVMAALLAAGPRSAASHSTAALLEQLRRSAPREVHLVVPMDRRAPQLSGVIGHRSRTLKTVDVLSRSGLRRTSTPRTLCDLAGERARPA